MGAPLRVLIVEDSEDDAAWLARELERGGYDLAWERVETAEAMREALERQPWDLVLSDHFMPGFSALAALAIAKEAAPDVPFIVATGSLGEEMAVEAMRAGASDYVLKNNLNRLLPAVKRELQEAKTRRERRAIEEHLEEMERLESLGRIAGGLAHDLGNMLTAVLGHADLARVRLPEGHAARTELQGIRDSVARAAALCSRLLAFARKQATMPVLLDLNVLVTDAIRSLRYVLGDSIDLEVALSPNLWPVRADEDQLRQVLISLAANARDAMPNGGKMTIETANLSACECNPGHVATSGADDCVMLAVSDTGVGLSEEVRAHLFEPFFTTKPPGQGSGLGLAACHGIVVQNHGTIWMDGKPGHGTAVKIYLPRARPGGGPSADREGTDHSVRGTETVLLVEDDESVRTINVRGLQAFGYSVLEAANGAEALDVAKVHAEHPIHILVTDVVMPHIGGRELCEKLRDSHPETVALFMSGHPGGAVELHDHLGHDFVLLRKPFSCTALARKIRQVLNNSGGPVP